MTAYTVSCSCGGSGYVHLENDLPGRPVGASCRECQAANYGWIGGKAYHFREDTATLWENILTIFAEQQPPMTVRQVFYALSVRGAVDKTDSGYRTAQYALAQMRRLGAIPFSWLADSTRWQRKPTTYSSMGDALTHWQRSYRRDLWASKNAYVEIWLEKDALAGVVHGVTSEYDVPLMVARGYGSMSFLYEAAEAIKEIGKPAYIYHFGDFDPSGVDAAYKIRDDLRQHGANIHFERVAVTEDQISTWNLPTRPTKATDPRAKTWGGKNSVELDAIPASSLRNLVETVILQHVAAWEIDELRRVEALERETLAGLMHKFLY